MDATTRTDVPRTHFVLVPGFGGFDALGSLQYYHGVTEALRGWKGAMYDAPLTLHYFPNVPTAAIETRARLLLDWLLERYKRGILRLSRGDSLHLVGHSTGGMDIRWMMKLLHDHAAHAADGAQVEELPAELFIKSISSVQFLSTPHRGSNLAHLFTRWSGELQLLAAVLYETCRALRLPGSRFLASSIKRLGWSAGWIDALLDTTSLLGSFDSTDGLVRARARASYFDTLKWLNDASDDFGAMADLDPGRHAEDPIHAKIFRTTYGHVRVRSIVTRAEPHPSAPDWDLFKICHRWTAHNPGAELGPDCSVRRLDAAGSVALGRAHNDGIVNSVSMVWPTPEESVYVDADHADIIGHYGDSDAPHEDVVSPDRNYKRYGLLMSSSGFDRERFLDVWRSVRGFALAAESGRERRAPSSRVVLPVFSARRTDPEAGAAADSAPAPRSEASVPSSIRGAEGAAP